jgi:Uma2 family endonuclease
MPEALHNDYRTTIETFRAFTDDRPGFEKWELIDGEMVLNPTPTNRHQIVVNNILADLDATRERTGASWLGIPGIGTRSRSDPFNEAVPDVMILPVPLEVSNWTFEALAVFEVLSPDSIRRDMVRKRDFYRQIPSLTHYIVLAQDRHEATVFRRHDEFSQRVYKESATGIEIEPLCVSLQLARIYRNVPLL